jgi:hypothetical protein
VSSRWVIELPPKPVLQPKPESITLLHGRKTITPLHGLLNSLISLQRGRLAW